MNRETMHTATMKNQLRLTLALFMALPAVFWVLATEPAAALETIAREAILIDTTTGTVLLEKNADTLMPPASMSKLMTIYLLFEQIRDGRLSLDDSFSVSENAWRKGGAKSGSSTMFLEPGKRVRVEDLIRGIIVQSGNDACIVVAEGLSGDEATFAKEMTERGRQLGLTNTTFRNSTGWPDPEHLTTARDLAILAQRMIEDFPQFYPIYAEKTFTYNGIRQSNRNPLLYKDMGADGLKTGHTKEAGYGLTASVLRNGRRLILVVNGLPTRKDRSREPERLLEWGFREYDNYALFKAGETVTDGAVWLGEEPVVPLVIEDGLTLTLTRKARKGMKVAVVFDEPIPAPIIKGSELAKLVITAPDTETKEIPLLAGADVARLGFTGRLSAALKHILWGESN